MMIILLLTSCGKSYEEQQRISKVERLRLAKEDSMALKVATLPTLDALPLFVAKERHFFDTLGVDIRLKAYNSQMDIDAALMKGRIEGGMSDLVRAQRMIHKGLPLKYATATNAYWQLIGNRMNRITNLKQMEDRMLAMTRYSVTDLLGDLAVDSAKLKPEYVFRVQVNDVHVRLHMLLNNEMDAMFLTEPQASTARSFKHPVLMDSRDKDIRMGAIVFREKDLKDQNRSKQYHAFIKAYNRACDSINHYGIYHYAPLLKKYTKADANTLKALPKLRFSHAAAPRAKDLERADKWLKSK